MLSFSKQLKNEIIMQDISAYCCSVSELAAYILILGKRKNDSLEILVEDENFANRIALISSKVLKTKVDYLKLSKDYSVLLNCGNKFSEKFGYLFSDLFSANTFSDVYKKNCCRAAFLRGLFLSCGTIINPEKNYNLEFSFKERSLALSVQYLLNSLDFELKLISRKGKFVLYVKKSDTICDILTFVGAYKAQMEILNLKIEREVRNDVNRTSNGETANLDKTFKAAIKHITAIEKISKTNGLESLSDELYETAVLRLNNREASIDELSKMFKTPITKSGVNHRLNKLVKIADEL